MDSKKSCFKKALILTAVALVVILAAVLGWFLL